MDKINTVSTAMIAFSTLIGVGGAIGTFFVGIGLSIFQILFNLVFYILLALIFLIMLWRKLK